MDKQISRRRARRKPPHPRIPRTAGQTTTGQTLSVSESSRILDRLLIAPSPITEALRAQIHWTQIWAYRHGVRQPSLRNAALIERLTRGAVRAEGWARP
jgi:hypothetical protein